MGNGYGCGPPASSTSRPGRRPWTGVNLTVLTGKAVAVTGPSGSRASRVRNLVAGLDRPPEDQVEVVQALFMRSVRTAAQEDMA